MSDPRQPPSETATIAPASADPGATQTPPTSPVSIEDPRSIPGYELLEELGRGGMGVVYKARQTHLNRIVALKMILGGAQSEDNLARFQREAEAVAQLTHPHIVQISEVGTWRAPQGDLLPYFSMEYCSGGSLSDYLDGTPLAPARAAGLVEVLARAVHSAHVKHLVHRDLKPANILLVADEGDSSAVILEKETVEQNTLLSALAQARVAVARRQGQVTPIPDSAGRKTASGTKPRPTATGERWMPKVTDFGLARRQDDDSGLTSTGAIVGTPSYMAPEQAEGKKDIGPAADVYALGAILYECLTGRPPFRAATPFETIMQVVGEDPVPPRQLNDRVPRDLETIALKCLRKPPGQRYASAADLAADLRRFLDGEPITARPAGYIERTVRWAKRRPTAAALVGVSLLALLVFVAGGAWFTWQLDRERLKAQQTAAERTKALLAVEKERDRAEDALRKLAREKRIADEQLARAEVNGYSLQIAFARKALDEWDITRATEMLAACKLELRGWEHRALGSELKRRVSPLVLPGVEKINTAVIQPQGEEIACAVEDRVLVTLLPSRKVYRTLQTKPGGKSITKLAYSRDGKLLAGLMGDRVLVWEPATNKELYSLEHGGKKVTSFFISADQSRLVSAADHSFHIWDLKTGKKLHLFPLDIKKDADAVAISADNMRLIALLPESQSPGKKMLPPRVATFDAQSGKGQQIVSGRATAFACDPSGELFAFGHQNGLVVVFDSRSAKMVTGMETHDGPIKVMTFSHVYASVTSPQLVTASQKTTGSAGNLRVWDARTARLVATLRRPSVSSDELSQSRNSILADCDAGGGVWLWNLGAARSEFGLYHRLFGNNEQFAEALEVSRTGQALAVRVLGMLGVWDVGTRKMRFRINVAAHSRPAFDPQGKALAVISAKDDRIVELFAPGTGKLIASLPGHRSSVTALAFSSDGQTLATADDSTILLWDLKTRQSTPLWTGDNKHDAHALAFSPDGTRLACSRSDGSVTILDRDRRKVVHRLGGEWGTSRALAFSPDSRTLAVGGVGPRPKDQAVPRPGSLRLWDVTSGKEIQSLPVPPSEVLNVAFSSDGRQLFSASGEGTVRIWDVKTGLQVHSLRSGGSALTAAAFSADGQRIALVGTDKVIHIHDAPAPAKK